MNKAVHHWNPESYSHYARLAHRFSAGTLALLQPQPGMKILDIGCGEGSISQLLQDQGAIVTGIDMNPDQIEKALQKGIDARLMDAREINFDNEFDAVFSNWTIHWIQDHSSLFSRICKALKPGGYFAAEFGATTSDFASNHFLAHFKRALPRYGFNLEDVAPVNFSTPKSLLQDLKASKLQPQTYKLVQHAIPLPGNMQEFVETIFNPIPVALESAWPQFISELTAEMAPSHLGPDGVWYLDFTRHQFLAIKAEPSPCYLVKR
ncbi:class I SAM-dependent methyltransferase [Spongorhabdus nitratireducens]